ncbi:unnamed protein product [Acanthoscelides obtectus]|nr:unnamed protein product [Acanthoscelides obtectus]CAK1651794.1 hypothetical protein AOBTE_LOCUS17456 [Acanthoscelides obtectus]
MKAMIKLPCYEFSQTGNQYYRKCDSVTYALATITETLKRHGVKYPNIGSIVCDGDGSYGPYTVKDGAAYCTSSDGARVGSYSLPDASFNLDKLNCNCARDKQKYNYKINCLENGNYNPLQTTQSNGYYCVDDDGFPKTDMFDREVNCTEYY